MLFRSFDERTGVITIKVVDIDHAFVGLHARTVVLASRQALSLLQRGRVYGGRRA